jgi:MFS family permease
VLAPFVGRIIDRAHPVPVIGFGFSMLAISMTWLSIELAPDTPIWRLVLPLMASGVGMAFVWSPLAATATRHLPLDLAGASSGVYNATRQLGAVLGSAGMAAFMTAQISDEMPPMPSNAAESDLSGALQLPGFLREPFATAMSQSMLLPAFISLLGIVTALFMLSIVRSLFSRRGGYDDELADDDYEDEDDYYEDDDGYDDGYDDDAYVEYVLRREPYETTPRPAPVAPPRLREEWRSQPADRWAASYGRHSD